MLAFAPKIIHVPVVRRKTFPKRPPTLNDLTGAQTFEAERFDPLVELIRTCKARKTSRDKDGNPIPDPEKPGHFLSEPLLEPKILVHALLGMIPYGRPQLRCAEVREQIDATFNLVIKTFEMGKPKVEVESKRVETLPPIDAITQ